MHIPLFFIYRRFIMQLLGVSFGEGNDKLGAVFTFSLPSKITCPGSSLWCRKKCYGTRYERLREKCRIAYERNLLLTKKPERFSGLMIGVIPRILSSFRIHVSGDFYCPEYIESWIKICSTFPNINFWAIHKIMERKIAYRSFRKAKGFTKCTAFRFNRSNHAASFPKLADCLY